MVESDKPNCSINNSTFTGGVNPQGISVSEGNINIQDDSITVNSEEVSEVSKSKIENSINISNSPNSPINAPVGTSGITNNNVSVASSDPKKGINWGNWLAVIGVLVAIVAIPVSMSVSGVFNDEFKEWFNRFFPSKVEQQSAPKSE